MSASVSESEYRLSIDDLIAAGFREGEPSTGDRHDREFWHTERDEKGKKWSVQVRFWRLSQFSSDDRVVEDGFDFVLHLRRMRSSTDGDDEWPRVEMSCHHMTPPGIIKWCASAHRSLNCDYLSLYED